MSPEEEQAVQDAIQEMFTVTFLGIPELLAYVQHRYNCAYLRPMWHHGLCDCGLHALIEKTAPTLVTVLRDAKTGIYDGVFPMPPEK
jgi:hypothetical protein